MTRVQAMGIKALALVLAALVWWPWVHHCYAPSDRPAARRTGRLLLEGHLDRWAAPGQAVASEASARALNPEWDLMQRTFTVLALAEAALADPDVRDLALAAGLVLGLRCLSRRSFPTRPSGAV